MEKILNEKVQRKLEEMAIDKSADISKQIGVSYLSETLSNPYIMGFLKETGECLYVGSEDHGGGHGLALTLRSDGFYVNSWREPDGDNNDAKKIQIREIPAKFCSLTAEEYQSQLNRSLEHSIQNAKDKYERLGRLFKKK